MSEITMGITIGGDGGAIAGITVWIIQYLQTRITKLSHRRRIYNWLIKNTENINIMKFRSTRAIASWNNLTEDRVQYICSIHKKIYLSTGEKEDLWSLYERGER